MKCNVENCNKVAYAKSHCTKHYQQILIHGKIRESQRDRRYGKWDGNVFLIPMGVGAKDGYAKVDEAFMHLDKYNWYMHHSGEAVTMIAKKAVSMQSMIINRPPDMVIDHINHDRADNRLSNLRVCTPTQNRRNSLKPKHNTLGYKGIKKFGQRYQAIIGYDGSYINLGMYSTPEEAAKAYDEKASELYGEFASLNFEQSKGE